MADEIYQFEVIKSLFVQKVKQGNILIKQGDFCRSFYTVVAGKLSLVKYERIHGSSKLGEVVKQKIGPGKGFGKKTLVHEEVMENDAKASKDCVLIGVYQSSFDKMLKKYLSQYEGLKVNFIENYLP